jgi:hypothetical protein
MGHRLYKITAYKIIGPYSLHVVFDDGTTQEIDLSPILYGEMYGPLRDIEFFNQVQLDSEVHTLVWPNGADFDPETLRNWPEYQDAWVAAAQRWKKKEIVTTT